MIQTGHSNCNATSDEMMVWANLIYYLKKRNTKTMHFDHLCIDEDPPKVSCDCGIDEKGKYHISCEASDSATLYEYRVEAYNIDNEVIGMSESIEVDASANFSHFVFSVDNSSTITVEKLIQTGETRPDIADLELESGRCIHVAAVDQIGNTSPVLHHDLSKCVLITNNYRVPYGMKLKASVFVHGLYYSLIIHI